MSNPHNIDAEWLYKVPASAGDAIVFTEALTQCDHQCSRSLCLSASLPLWLSGSLTCAAAALPLAL